MAIGIFDSGYGGLTILKEIKKRLPQYDYLYLGDNARAPYGTRSFDIVYQFTLQAVRHLFDKGCHLVILACNTASAKALRSIQQNDLPATDPSRRVLGVIRPTVEAVPSLTRSGHVGLLATPGTVTSHSYLLELQKSAPDVTLTERACPMWVPLVENNETESPAADYYVGKYIDGILADDPAIDTLVLGCTHYPLLLPKIERHTPPGVNILSQGTIVAESLADYLHRHPEIDAECTKGGTVEYLTTENPERFESMASKFMQEPVKASKTVLDQAPAITDTEEQYTKRGMELWAQGQHAAAISSWLKAVAVNPTGPAATALANARAILDYRNPDLLNP